MANKKDTKKPQWLKIILVIIGILIGLIVLITISLKIWVLTWPEYKGDGFSIRYPKGWHTDYGVSGGFQTPYTFNITTPPIITSDGYNFSNVPLRIFLDVANKQDSQDKAFIDTDGVITNGIKIKDGVYLRLSFPYSSEYLILKDDKIYDATADIDLDRVGGNILKQTYYWLNGLLVILSLH